MLQHSAILITYIKPPFVIKTFVLSIFEWPLKTCSTGKIKIFLTLKLSNVALILLINVKMPTIVEHEQLNNLGIRQCHNHRSQTNVWHHE